MRLQGGNWGQQLALKTQVTARQSDPSIQYAQVAHLFFVFFKGGGGGGRGLISPGSLSWSSCSPQVQLSGDATGEM